MNPNVSAPPAESENTYSDKQSNETSPPNSTNVPIPAGTTDPVNENPKTAEALEDTVNPLASASPPPALVTQPL